MSTSDAFVVGESWLSEHFFTTDARSQSFQAKVLERRTAWDADADTEAGPSSTPRSRFLAQRGDLQRAMAELSQRVEALAEQASSQGLPVDTSPLAADSDALAEQLLTVLGFTQHGLQRTGHGLTAPEESVLSRIAAPGIQGAGPLAVVKALPVASVDELIAKDGLTLGSPVALVEGDDPTRSAARLLSQLFVSETPEGEPPAFALVLAGRWALVAEKERWAEGRYLAVDLQTVAERNQTSRGGEIDKALTCLSADSLAPDADGAIWWQATLEESVKHTVGVSQDLRQGVRLSIEIIANDVVQRRRQQDLAPLPGDQAQPLAQQALRYLYRILFLLYAEASPELDVLPVGAPEYDSGYSLDRLREITQVTLASEKAQRGTHLFDSLAVLFLLVDQGHDGDDEGLTFSSLRADLFRPEATALIDETRLSNAALQQVLGHLLLSPEKRGRDRGFISYAELGINQLGAVYEGLMSYTGFFAETDLYEVAKGGDSSKGSWVVPTDRADHLSAADFVRVEDPHTGEPKPVVHRQGTFVFRLSGRDRQQSASYYTPEVLTRFTVGQAIAELVDQEGTTTAADVLSMSVCEPALGSGAFAIEAVRQLAEQYLERRQKELGERIDPDAYPKELQRAKAHIALHNVYGVDLNATAVELAEISLWLDTMVAGLDAPWFGLHLRRGNSLVGARRAVYERHQVNDKTWLTTTPREVPLTSLVADMKHPSGTRVGSGICDGGGAIHHFLLPAAGWGAAADAKEAVALAPDAAKALKMWRASMKSKPSRQQLDALAEITYRMEVLWQMALRRLQIAEQQASRGIGVWGAETNAAETAPGTVTREQIEESLADDDGAYRRLRRVMDAWCALWFWPLATPTNGATQVERDGQAVTATPPTLDAWINALRGLVGRAPDLRKRNSPGNLTFATATSWEELGVAEELELDFANARHVADVVQEHPWLEICGRVAARQGFFHWNLDFATVFARGGFDLQVGNPPWVRPRSDVDALLAEGDPWWQLTLKPSEDVRDEKRAETLKLPGLCDLVLDGTTEVASLADYLGSSGQYPHLAGLQPDLYRCFMVIMWRHVSMRGAIGLIHLESHFTDEKAGTLRRSLYPRLRQHWHFVNEYHLFEMGHQKQFGITIQGRQRESVDFLQACWLYHPSTAYRSLAHNGDGPEPGLKDLNGAWDLRPHSGRITRVTEATLTSWRDALETQDTPPHSTRMVYAVNAAASETLVALGRAPRISGLNLHFSAGWHEKNDRTKGYFATNWGSATSWDEAILQGPHLHLGNPFYKAPNATLLHKQDWLMVDLESLTSNELPVTAYKPAGNFYTYECAYDDWGTEDEPATARDYYRIAWRTMAANQGERTLIPAIIPPGSAHVDGVFSTGSPKLAALDLAAIAGQLASLLSDFAVRTAPKSTIRASTASRLPGLVGHDLSPKIALRALRLNCLTDAYADLFRDAFDPAFAVDSWTSDHPTVKLAVDSDQWTAETPLRRAIDRRQALLEIDALVALSLGITADELCAVYRTQFPVLYGYDTKRDHYDANGRIVPTSVIQTWRTRGDRITHEERTAAHPGSGVAYTYELPFATLDREADMRQAYAVFESRLAARQKNAGSTV